MNDVIFNISKPLGILAKVILTDKWETEKIIDKIKIPILFLSSEKDKLIP